MTMRNPIVTDHELQYLLLFIALSHSNVYVD